MCVWWGCGRARDMRCVESAGAGGGGAQPRPTVTQITSVNEGGEAVGARVRDCYRVCTPHACHSPAQGTMDCSPAQGTMDCSPAQGTVYDHKGCQRAVGHGVNDVLLVLTAVVAAAQAHALADHLQGQARGGGVQAE